MFGCKRQENVEKDQGLEKMGERSQVAKVGETLCKKHRDCEEGFYCDSLSGYKCKKRCVPDNGEFYTASKDCPGVDRICRADGRCSSKYFETVWKIDKSDPVLILPDAEYGCDVEIDWGDGEVSKGCDVAKVHEYKNLEKDVGNLVRVRISGKLSGWSTSKECVHIRCEVSSHAAKLVEVVSFGRIAFPLEVKNIINGLLDVYDKYGAFEGCVNLEKVPLDDMPDASTFLNAKSMFKGAKRFNGAIGHWDVSQVWNMVFMFGGASSFNQPLEDWDVSQVRDMSMMFSFAKSFNQPLEGWDVSKVKSMERMFSGASSFNQALENWDVSKVKDMARMFEGAKAFNQSLEGWKISSGVLMESMFHESGLGKEHYCKMMQGSWREFFENMGIKYSCE